MENGERHRVYPQAISAPPAIMKSSIPGYVVLVPGENIFYTFRGENGTAPSRYPPCKTCDILHNIPVEVALSGQDE